MPYKYQGFGGGGPMTRGQAIGLTIVSVVVTIGYGFMIYFMVRG